jgi:pimeloyl-ACP methyl ester carboxylesterase
MGSGQTEVDGGTLYTETAGRGAPVVLLHGGFGDRRMWDDQFLELAKGFEVVRYDQRGFGQSPPPTAAYSPVADLIRVLDNLHISTAHLVGNSMGGTLALDFALLHPERTGKVVVIASTASGYPAPEAIVKSVTDVFATARRDGTAAAADLWLHHPMVKVASVRDSTKDRLRTMIRENQRTLLMEHWPQEPMAPPAFERLGDVNRPVLFIIGDQDVSSVIDGARESAAGIAGARLETVHGADHLPQMEEPEQINRTLLAFLNP